MKKIYILALMMSFTAYLMAQDALVPGKKLHSLSPISSVKTPTDTLTPYGIVHKTGFTIYNLLTGTAPNQVYAGYVFGTNTQNKAQAQTFTLTQSYYIEEVLLWCFKKNVIGTAGDLVVSVNRCDATGTAYAGTVTTAPGTQVASTTISSTDIDTTGFLTIAYFTTPVYINSNYAIVLDYSTYGDDSLAIVSCIAGDPGTVETSWMKNATTNAWRTIRKSFGSTNNIDMYLRVVTDQSTAGIDSPNFIDGMKFSSYPNPAINNTNIAYELQSSGNVKLEVIDSHGRTVLNVNEASQSAGKYNVNFNTEKISSGNYYVTLETNGKRLTKKLVVSK